MTQKMLLKKYIAAILLPLLSLGVEASDFIVRDMSPSSENGFSWVSYANNPRWPDKDANGATRIKWYFNTTAGRDTTADQLRSVIGTAMANWESVCNVKFEYQGTTSAKPNQSTTTKSDGLSVIGFSTGTNTTMGLTMLEMGGQFGSTNYEADVTLYDNFSTHIGNALKFMSLQGTVTHELGHVLGLTNSDVVESIMYAKPYHAMDYNATIRQDDIAGCVAKYGEPVIRKAQQYTTLDAVASTPIATTPTTAAPTTIIGTGTMAPANPKRPITSSDIVVTTNLTKGQKTVKIALTPDFASTIVRSRRFLVAYYKGLFFGYNGTLNRWIAIPDVTKDKSDTVAVSAELSRNGIWSTPLEVTYTPGTLTGVKLYFAYGFTLNWIALDKSYALAYEITD